MTRMARSELKNPAYEIFIAALSILSIVNLVLIYVTKSDALDQVLIVMNALLSVIFFGDFLFRLFTAQSKARYVFREFGWADLLASLPFPQFKVLRIFRLVRVFLLLRERGIRVIGRTLLRERASSALYVLLLMGILVLQFGSLTMLYVEQQSGDANITSASDAVWYTMVTISTVGYGDQYPVTIPGRVLGAIIIVIGVGIFGTFTGYLANAFLGSKDAAADESVQSEPAVAQDTVAALRALLAKSEANLAEMRQLVDKAAGDQKE